MQLCPLESMDLKASPVGQLIVAAQIHQHHSSLRVLLAALEL